MLKIRLRWLDDYDNNALLFCKNTSLCSLKKLKSVLGSLKEKKRGNDYKDQNAMSI